MDHLSKKSSSKYFQGKQKWLKTSDLARIWGMKPTMIQNLHRSGFIPRPRKKWGMTNYWRKDKLIAWLQNHLAPYEPYD